MKRSAAKKNARLTALEASLPTPLHELRSTTNRQATGSEVVETMRGDGMSRNEVFAYRADEFDENTRR